MHPSVEPASLHVLEPEFRLDDDDDPDEDADDEDEFEDGDEDDDEEEEEDDEEQETWQVGGRLIPAWRQGFALDFRR